MKSAKQILAALYLFVNCAIIWLLLDLNMRIFTAFPSTEEAIVSIKKNMDVYTAEYPRSTIRWVNQKQLHVTLNFFNDISEREVTFLISIIQQEVRNLPSFKFLSSKFSFYPNNHRPQVLSIEMDETGGDQCIKFQRSVMSKLVEANILKESKKWNPHITIGRFNKFSNDKIDVSKIRLEQFVWKVERLNIYESRLTEKGPIHIVLKSFDLK